jgi:hypothetical protein
MTRLSHKNPAKRTIKSWSFLVIFVTAFGQTAKGEDLRQSASSNPPGDAVEVGGESALPAEASRQDAPPAAAGPGKDSRTSRINRSRSQWAALVQYSYADLLVLSKWGATGIYQDSDNLSCELEYSQGAYSIPFFVDDLGAFEEQRLNFSRRTFLNTNSFSLFANLMVQRVELRFGNRWLKSAMPELPIPEIDPISVTTLGAGVGIGNRWILDSGLTIGFDWFSYMQPLTTLTSKTATFDRITNESARNTAKDVFSIMNYFPRFSVLKFGLGWSF